MDWTKMPWTKRRWTKTGHTFHSPLQEQENECPFFSPSRAFPLKLIFGGSHRPLIFLNILCKKFIYFIEETPAHRSCWIFLLWELYILYVCKYINMICLPKKHFKCLYKGLFQIFIVMFICSNKYFDFLSKSSPLSNQPLLYLVIGR